MTEKDRANLIASQKRVMKDVEYSPVLVRRIVESVAADLIRRAYKGHKSSYENYSFSDVVLKEPREYAIAAIRDIISQTLSTADIVARGVERAHIGTASKKKFKKEEFLNSLIYGKALEERSNQYFNDLVKELTVYVRVGLRDKLDAERLIEDFVKNKKNPSQSDIVITGIATGLGRLKGRSALDKMTMVVEDVSVRGIHATNAYYWRLANHKEIITSSDSHVCEECQSLNGKTFPVEYQVLPVHNACRCMEIPHA